MADWGYSPLKPKAITFDVAGTLLEARWNPGVVVEQAARNIGLNVPTGSGMRFAATYLERRPEFEAVNKIGDASVKLFWLDLDATWLEELGLDPAYAEPLYNAGLELLFGPDAKIFIPYSDVSPALERLSAGGIRLAVISNWDNSLLPVLDHLGWTRYFEVIIPSLVFGHEKPDPLIFGHALQRLGLEPHEILHVGDDPIDDLGGARNVGIPAALIDRSRAETSAPYLHSLDDLEIAFQWIS